jgi:hypothetical protein
MIVDISEGIANLPEDGWAYDLDVDWDYKPHVDGLPYRVQVRYYVGAASRRKTLMWCATQAEATCAYRQLTQYIESVKRLTSSGS